MSDQDAAADLLSSHGLGAGAEAMTQNNLKILKGKAKSTLSTPRGTGVAAHASTSGPSGDARVRFDAVAFEAVVQGLSGDSPEDTRDLLRTLFLIVRLIFAGKQAPTTTELLRRAAALASGFSVYVTQRIVSSDVCGTGPKLDAVLSETVIRSFLDGNLFLDFQSLCKPLAAPEVRPYEELERLAAEGGIPSHEAVVRMLEAYDELFEDLGYAEW
jgi:hypothetical protein